MKPTYLLALGAFLTSVVAASQTAAQKPAPLQPAEQQKVKERVDTLESQLKEAQAKADRAAMEKDYIERIQKEVNAYYEKAFATQIIVITIIGLIVSLVGKFGVDHIVQSKLTEASSKLHEDFTAQLAVELQKLNDSNAVQLKQLEDDLNQRIEKKVTKLETETTVSLFFSLAVSFALAEKYAEARGADRCALESLAKNPEDFTPTSTQSIVNHLFRMIKAADPQKFHQEAKKELAADLYKKFENQLNATAIDIPDLAQVLKERRDAPPSTPKS
jgi:hypothetical protein